MSKQNKMKNVKRAGAVVAAAAVTSLAMSSVQAAENPFGFNKLNAGYMQLSMSDSPEEGKCGEGKCGGTKSSEGKCGEGKCGGTKTSEGKCGEGKCGGSK